jgi:hypothetical protein
MFRSVTGDLTMCRVGMGQMGQSTERNMPSVYTCIKQTNCSGTHNELGCLVMFQDNEVLSKRVTYVYQLIKKVRRNWLHLKNYYK